MGRFGNLKIAARMGLGFALVIGAGLLIAFYGGWTLGKVNGATQVLMHQRMVAIDEATQIKDQVNVIARGVRNMVLLTEPEAMQAER